MEKTRVLLLMGGESSEREVSLKTGDRIINAIVDANNIDIIPVDVSKSGQWMLARSIDEFSRGSILELSNFNSDRSLKVTSPLSKGSLRIDCAFIALHGRDGEDGKVQGFLETMGVPYSGSGILASALAMDKSKSNKYFAGLGITMPRIVKVLESENNTPRDVVFPVMVIPNNSGSSRGASKCNSLKELESGVKEAFKYDTEVLIVEYIDGKEYSCGVLDYNLEIRALPVIGIEPKLSQIFDYESKYQAGGSIHTIPAKLNDNLTKEVQDVALKAHIELGCRDMSRSDFIIKDGIVYLLEVNTIPGLTETSLLPQSAEVGGTSLKDIVLGIIAKTLSRGIGRS